MWIFKFSKQFFIITLSSGLIGILLIPSISSAINNKNSKKTTTLADEIVDSGTVTATTNDYLARIKALENKYSFLNNAFFEFRENTYTNLDDKVNILNQNHQILNASYKILDHDYDNIKIKVDDIFLKYENLLNNFATKDEVSTLRTQTVALNTKVNDLESEQNALNTLNKEFIDKFNDIYKIFGTLNYFVNNYKQNTFVQAIHDENLNAIEDSRLMAFVQHLIDNKKKIDNFQTEQQSLSTQSNNHQTVINGIRDVIEELSTNYNDIFDNYTTLTNNLEIFTNKFNAFKSTFEQLNTDNNLTDDEVTTIKEHLQALTDSNLNEFQTFSTFIENMRTATQEIDSLKTNYITLTNTLTQIEKNIIASGTFKTTLEEKMATLEQNTNDLMEKFAGIDLSALKNIMPTIKSYKTEFIESKSQFDNALIKIDQDFATIKELLLTLNLAFIRKKEGGGTEATDLINSIEQEITTLTNKFANFKISLTTLSDQVNFNKKFIDENYLVDSQKWGDHYTALFTVKIPELQKQIDALQSNYNNLIDNSITPLELIAQQSGTNILDLKTKIEANQDEISSLETAFTDLKAKVDVVNEKMSFQTKLNEIKTNINLHTTDITNLTEKWTTLKTKVNELETAIGDQTLAIASSVSTTDDLIANNKAQQNSLVTFNQALQTLNTQTDAGIVLINNINLKQQNLVDTLETSETTNNNIITLQNNLKQTITTIQQQLQGLPTTIATEVQTQLTTKFQEIQEQLTTKFTSDLNAANQNLVDDHAALAIKIDEQTKSITAISDSQQSEHNQLETNWQNNLNGMITAFELINDYLKELITSLTPPIIAPATSAPATAATPISAIIRNKRVTLSATEESTVINPVLTNTDLSNALTNLKNNLEDLSIKLTGINLNDISSNQAEIIELKNNFNQIKLDLVTQTTKHEEEIKSFETQFDNLNQNNLDYKSKFDALLKAYNSQILTWESQLDAIQTQKTKINAQLETLISKITTIADTQTTLLPLITTTQTNTDQLAENVAQINALKIKIATLNTEVIAGFAGQQDTALHISLNNYYVVNNELTTAINEAETEFQNFVKLIAANKALITQLQTDLNNELGLLDPTQINRNKATILQLQTTLNEELIKNNQRALALTKQLNDYKTTLEAKIAQIETQSLQVYVDDFESVTGNLKTQVDGLANKFINLQTNLTDLETRIGTTLTDIQADKLVKLTQDSENLKTYLDTQIINFNQKITENNNKLTTFKQQITDEFAKIDQNKINENQVKLDTAINNLNQYHTDFLQRNQENTDALLANQNELIALRTLYTTTHFPKLREDLIAAETTNNLKLLELNNNLKTHQTNLKTTEDRMATILTKFNNLQLPIINNKIQDLTTKLNDKFSEIDVLIATNKQTLASEQIDLNNKIQQINDVKLIALNTKVDDLKIFINDKVTIIDERFKQQKKTFTDLQTQLTEYIATINLQQISDTTTGLTTLNKQYIADLTQVNEKITLITNNFINLKDKFSTFDTNQKTNIEEIEKKITQLRTNFAQERTNIKQQILTSETKITALQNTLDQVDPQTVIDATADLSLLTTNQADSVQALQTKITGNLTELNNFKALIDSKINTLENQQIAQINSDLQTLEKDFTDKLVANKLILDTDTELLNSFNTKFTSEIKIITDIFTENQNNLALAADNINDNITQNQATIQNHKNQLDGFIEQINHVMTTITSTQTSHQTSLTNMETTFSDQINVIKATIATNTEKITTLENDFEEKLNTLINPQLLDTNTNEIANLKILQETLSNIQMQINSHKSLIDTLQEDVNDHKADFSKQLVIVDNQLVSWENDFTASNNLINNNQVSLKIAAEKLQNHRIQSVEGFENLNNQLAEITKKIALLNFNQEHSNDHSSHELKNAIFDLNQKFMVTEVDLNNKIKEIDKYLINPLPAPTNQKTVWSDFYDEFKTILQPTKEKIAVFLQHYHYLMKNTTIFKRNDFKIENETYPSLGLFLTHLFNYSNETQTTLQNYLQGFYDTINILINSDNDDEGFLISELNALKDRAQNELNNIVSGIDAKLNEINAVKNILLLETKKTFDQLTHLGMAKASAYGDVLEKLRAFPDDEFDANEPQEMNNGVNKKTSQLFNVILDTHKNLINQKNSWLKTFRTNLKTKNAQILQNINNLSGVFLHLQKSLNSVDINELGEQNDAFKQLNLKFSALKNLFLEAINTYIVQIQNIPSDITKILVANNLTIIDDLNNISTQFNTKFTQISNTNNNLKTTLDTYQVEFENLNLAIIADNRKIIANLQEKLTQATTQLAAEITNRADAINALATTLQNDYVNQETFTDFQTQLTTQLSSNNQKIIEFQTKFDNLSTQVETLINQQTELDGLVLDVENIKAQLTILNPEFQKLKAKLGILEEVLNLKIEASDTMSLTQKLTQLIDQHQINGAQTFSNQKQLISITSKIIAYDKELVRINNLITTNNDAFANLSQEFTDVTDKIIEFLVKPSNMNNASNGNVFKLQESFTTIQQELNSFKTKFNLLNDQILNLDLSNYVTTSSFEQLSNVVNTLNSYYQGRFLRAKENFFANQRYLISANLKSDKTNETFIGRGLYGNHPTKKAFAESETKKYTYYVFTPGNTKKILQRFSAKILMDTSDNAVEYLKNNFTILFDFSLTPDQNYKNFNSFTNINPDGIGFRVLFSRYRSAGSIFQGKQKVSTEPQRIYPKPEGFFSILPRHNEYSDFLTNFPRVGNYYSQKNQLPVDQLPLNDRNALISLGIPANEFADLRIFNGRVGTNNYFNFGGSQWSVIVNVKNYSIRIIASYTSKISDNTWKTPFLSKPIGIILTQNGVNHVPSGSANNSYRFVDWFNF